MRTALGLQLFYIVCILLVLKTMTSCGTDPDPPADGDADADADGGLDGGPGSCGEPRIAAVVTTDYVTGGTALIDLDTRASSGHLVTIHSDAVVRCPCGYVAVIERMLGDNLNLLAPAGDQLESVAQISLGLGTNPQDAVFVDNKAYVTLLETSELVAVDLGSGAIVQQLPLTDLADADGNAEPTAIYEFEDSLVVALQRLDRDNSMDPAMNAVLAVVDRETLGLDHVIELIGSNPVTGIKPRTTDGVVLIGHAGFQDDPLDGGIEAVDLVLRQSQGMVIDGAELGGNVEDFVVVDDHLAYATTNSSDGGAELVSFDPEEGITIEVLATGPSWSLHTIAFDSERRHLLVASSDDEAPGVRFFDADDGSEIGSAVPTGLPAFDLCLVPEPIEADADADADADVDADADADGDTDADADEECEFPWEGVDPFADEVVSFEPVGAGTGADDLPGVVLGPPMGGGELRGSSDIVSLGCGGSIVLRFDPPVITDRPGPDLIVFENAFVSGGGVFAEPGQVAVSADGETFLEFPCDPVTLEGCAGISPVFASPGVCIDPTDPAVAGGDAFDLADVGLSEASYVRITDRSAENDDASRWCSAASAGFDLDAVAVVME